MRRYHICMSKIVHSDVCPSDVEVFSLGQGPTVKIAKGGSYSTTDPIEVANAIAHPWLTVEPDKGSGTEGVWYPTLDPKEDALSAESSVAFDPKAVKAARDKFNARYNTPDAQDVETSTTPPASAAAPKTATKGND